MIRRYLCLPILLATAFWFVTPTRAQQASPAQHAQSQHALRTSDWASRGAVAVGTPSVPQAEVKRLRIANTGSCAQMTIEFGGWVQYQAARLADPDRIYFDIENAQLSNELLHRPIGIPPGGCLKAVRVAQNRPDMVRVVLDVAHLKDYSVSELADPDRLVVDIRGASDNTAVATTSAQETSANTVEVSHVRTSNTDSCVQMTIELGGRVQYQAGRLADPDRIYFDIENARLSDELLHQPIGIPSGRCLKAVRVAQNRPDMVRVVLDVAQVKDYSVSELADPDRLVVDVRGAFDNTAVAATSVPETSAKSTALTPGSSATGTQGEPAAPKTAPVETASSPAVNPLPVSVNVAPSQSPMPGADTGAAVGQSPAPKPAADLQAPPPAPKPTPATSSKDTGAVHGGVQDPHGTTAPVVGGGAGAAVGQSPAPKLVADQAPPPVADTQAPPPAPKPTPATSSEDTGVVRGGVQDPHGTTAPVVGGGAGAAVGQSPAPKLVADQAPPPVADAQAPPPAPKPTPVKSSKDLGVVHGGVQDPDGTAVPDVNVDLTASTGEQPLTTTTDDEGAFEFLKVPPGDYVLHVTVLGFEPVEKPVTVGSEPVARIHLKLKIAQVSDKVTVSGQSVVFAEDNRSQAQFNEHLVMNLPAKDGDPLTVPSLFINPAVVGSSGPTIIVDGVETSSLDLPTSSVRSVTVDQNPYSPEFGRPGKGRLEVTTRKGVHRHYRGNVLALFRNSAFDARNALAQERPLQQRGIGEAELDGPLNDIFTHAGETTFFVAGRYHVFNNSAIVDASTPAGLVENGVITPAGRFIQNVGVPERRLNLFGRIDSHPSSAHKISFFYKYKNNSLDNQGIGGLDLPDRATNIFNHENEVKILETATPSANFQNQVRLTYKDERTTTSGLAAGYAVDILGSADFGSAPTNRSISETLGDMQDVASLFYGRHNLRFGTGLKLRYFSTEDRSNFGGTFVFSCLNPTPTCPLAFSDNRPSQFTMNVGNPSVDFSEHEVYSFLQDDLRLRPDLSLMMGLRYEFQPSVSHYQNLAPRVAVAYSPQATNALLANTVFRGGFGIFYDRQPYLMQQDSLLYNGSAIQQIVLSSPSFPQPFPPGSLPTSVSPPSIMTTDPNIRFPYVMQGSFAIERKIGRGQNFVTVEFSTMRGVDLYRSRNLNAPLPGTTTLPNPNFVNIDQFEASGSSQSKALTVTYKGNVRKVSLMAQYVLSRTLDDVTDSQTGVSGFLYTPANNYDPHADWSRSDLDRRHRFNMTFIYPWKFGLQASGVVNVWSGLPYNITTGTDDNGDHVFNDRPSGLWRNAGRGAGFTDVDLRLSKRWRVFPQMEHAHSVEFAWDAFNIFNHVNYQNYNGVIISPTFGQPYAAFPARQLQVSVRYHF